MATLSGIEQYRAARPFSILEDDEIAWLIDNPPDCVADVLPEIKARLEVVGQERPPPPPPAARLAAAPINAYDFTALPHGGRLRLLPEAGSQGSNSNRTTIAHSIVGSGEGAWQMFANTSSLESTIIVLKSGFAWQLMSRKERADANRNANGYATSYETEDNGNPDADPWTAAQCQTLAALAIQDMRDFGIPSRRSPSCTDFAGHGYHTLHGSPSCWTPVAKSCPGTVRKRQWNDTILPMILQGGLDMEADLSAAAKKWLLAELEKSTVRGVRWDDHGVPDQTGAGNNHARIRADLAAIKLALDAQSDDEAKILAAISGLSGEQTAAFTALAGQIQGIDAGMDDAEVQAAAQAMASELSTILPPAFVAAFGRELLNLPSSTG